MHMGITFIANRTEILCHTLPDLILGMAIGVAQILMALPSPSSLLPYLTILNIVYSRYKGGEYRRGIVQEVYGNRCVSMAGVVDNKNTALQSDIHVSHLLTRLWCNLF